MEKFRKKYPYVYFIRRVYHYKNQIIIDDKHESFLHKKEKVKRTSKMFYEKRIPDIHKSIVYQNEIIHPEIIPFLSWDDIQRSFDRIWNTIRERNYQTIIGIRTGGHYVGMFFQKWIEEKTKKKINYISCKTKRYVKHQTSILDDIEFPLNVQLSSLQEPILIMDDIVRYGYTIKKIMEYMKNNGKKEVDTYVIFDSPFYRTTYSMNNMYKKKEENKNEEKTFLRLFCAPWGFDT